MKFVITAPCLALALLLGDGLSAAIAIREIVVDGRPIEVPARSDALQMQPIRIPSSAHTVTFSFRDLTEAAPPQPLPTPPEDAPPRPVRLRYRLDGVDPDWRDPPASGRVKLTFEDADYSAIDGLEQLLTGETHGWRGTPETSDFQPFSISGVVPPDTRIVSAYLLSHNPETTVGVMAIDEAAFEIERMGTQSRERIPLPAVDDDSRPSSPNRTPRWTKTGTKLPMSRFVTLNNPVAHPALVTVDDDPRRYNGWTRHQPLDVAAGDRVTFSCAVAHSFGRGGQAQASYRNLQPGNYRFHVGAFTPGGAPTTVETSIPIEIYVPWWLRRDVWAAAGAAGFAIGVAAVRTVSLRRMKRRLAEVEREHALERERARIARDLHDDVGAGLTEIAMKAEWVKEEIGAAATSEALGLTDDIRASAHALVRGIDAIVWAVNPANDTLERFAAYLVQATEQFLDAAGLEMRFDIPADLPPRSLPGAVRHRLFLATREAVHNAVKHARAAAVSVTLAVHAGRLVLTVADDGRGFDAAHASGAPGHDGLDNMQQRLAEIGGTCEIASMPGHGTRVTFSVPLSAALPEQASHA